jgi:hypothetical protein
MRVARVLLFAGLLSALAACSSDMQGSADTTETAAAEGDAKLLVLGQGVWDGFQAYLKKVDSSQRGAFAIAQDGASAFADRTCAATTCADTSQIEAEAIAACQDSGSDCVIFAIDRTSQIPYRTPQ